MKTDFNLRALKGFQFFLLLFLISSGCKSNIGESSNEINLAGRDLHVDITVPHNDYISPSSKINISGPCGDKMGIVSIKVIVNEQTFDAVFNGTSWVLNNVGLIPGKNIISARMMSSDGLVTNSKALNVFLYWEIIGQMPDGISDFNGSFVYDAKAYLSGGFTSNVPNINDQMLVYRFSDNKFDPPVASSARADGNMIFYNNILYFFNGYLAFTDKPFHVNSQQYSLNGNLITSFGIPDDKKRVGAVVQVVNNKFYIIGGQDPNGQISSAFYEYNPTDNSYLLKGNFKNLFYSASIVYKDNIYIFGGMDENQRYLDGIYVYNPSANTFSQIGSLSKKRAGMTPVMIGSKVYLMGGESYLVDDNASPVVSDMIEVFDLEKALSKVLLPMPYQLAYFAAEAYLGQIYLFGGVRGGGMPKSQMILRYTPEE